MAPTLEMAIFKKNGGYLCSHLLHNVLWCSYSKEERRKLFVHGLKIIDISMKLLPQKQYCSMREFTNQNEIILQLEIC